MIKDLNIIIPLKDEDEQVETTVNLLTNELKNLKKNYIITFIDDHSHDDHGGSSSPVIINKGEPWRGTL